MLNQKVSKQKKPTTKPCNSCFNFGQAKMQDKLLQAQPEEPAETWFSISAQQADPAVTPEIHDSVTDESRTEEGTKSVLVHFILLTFLMFDVSGHEPNKHNQAWIKLEELAGNGASYKCLLNNLKYYGEKLFFQLEN